MLSSKIIKGAVLKVYKGAPTTLKDKVNADLLDFIEAKAASASGRVA
jgi:non-heme chloroperoxidase